MGGVNEIGGNKILLQDGDTRVFLDFGKSFAQRSYFFSDPFLVPREMEDLLELGMIEPMKEIYKLEPPTNELKTVDAVVLSHVHADHADHVSLIHPTIPVYLGQTGKFILDSAASTRYRQMDCDMSEVSFRTFRTGDRLKIGKLEIEPIHVDHSIPGSYGFIIHTSSGPIAYTGDFRLHGPRGDMSEEFVRRAEQVEPLVLISEGTNVFSPPFFREEEIQEKLEGLIASSPGLVLVSFLFKDVDRYRTICNAAKGAKRKLVLSFKQGHLLRSLGRDPALVIPSLDDPDIFFLLRRRGCYYDWETELFEQWEKKGKVVTAEGIGKRQEEFILSMNSFDLPELVRIKPIPGSLFIMSVTEPYNEEMEVDYERLTHWLIHFGLPLYSLHSSGHIFPHDLRRVVQRIRPQKLFLIHSERPQLLARYLGDRQIEIVIPEKGSEYTL